MSKEVEQLDIFTFLDTAQKKPELEQLDVGGIKVGQRLLIADETKIPSFIGSVRMGYRTGMTATVIGGFCGNVEILLDEEHWEKEPRRIPASMSVLAKELESGAFELIKEVSNQ